jgi:hypothetical protein
LKKEAIYVKLSIGVIRSTIMDINNLVQTEPISLALFSFLLGTMLTLSLTVSFTFVFLLLFRDDETPNE